MAGSLSLSLSQQFNSLGQPLAGGKFYTFAASTTNPQSAYQDTALTLAHPNPIVLDAAGRVPVFYLADGNIKIRLTDANGVVQVTADNLLVIGPSSGSGSTPSVDATTVLATGDIKTRYGTGTLSGFVRLNARTIGSPTSGATERANSDTQVLFEYLWNADSALTVSTGRGASSTADYNANKTIALPDGRGRVLAALDDMGNSAAGRLSTIAGTVLGTGAGLEKLTLFRTDLPNVSISPTITDPGHTHTGNLFATGGGNGGGAGGVSFPGSASATSSSGTGITAAFNLNGNVTQTLPALLQPTLLITNYIKL